MFPGELPGTVILVVVSVPLPPHFPEHRLGRKMKEDV